MLISHAMVKEGHLQYHKKILVKWVPEYVPAMPISFLLHECWLDHGLIRCLPNCLEWIESSRCDSDQRDSSQNLFYSNLELSRCYSNLQNLCVQLFQLQNYSRAQHF